MNYIVYETTNLLNGKKYIGKHSTNDINDGYLGSGKVLKRAIKKYGKENFEREILLETQDEAQAYRMEDVYITLEIINDPMYYNIAGGGNGAGSGEKHPLYGRTGKDAPMYGRTGKDAPMYGRTGEKNPMYGRTGEKNPMYGRTGEKNPNSRLTEKQVIEIKERLQNGERNIDIAKGYDVTKDSISKIKTGKRWKHITI